uniref:AN1-type domain-containing protein n=1 Tax=Opuntia streptacantha TaxID=393608 RepID=A0A7C8Z773_OPUST
MGGGTEAFPELGGHCQHPDCHQLDFLPFNCDGCHKLLCLEHRTYKSHGCPKSDLNSRKVVVCEVCSSSVETTGKFGEEEKAILEKHNKSKNCDPSKKKKPRCPVRRCKEYLTFSNTAICKSCDLKVCLKHRFPADHACKRDNLPALASGLGNKFLVALAARNGRDCAKNEAGEFSSPTSNARSVEAC